MLMMNAELEKVKEHDEAIKANTIVAPDALNMDEDRAMMALNRAKAELEKFYNIYNKSNESESEYCFTVAYDCWEVKGNCDYYINLIFFSSFSEQSKATAKSELFSSIRRSVQGLPNLILYRTIHKAVTNELESLLHRDNSSHCLNKTGNVEEGIARNISDAYQRFILRSTQLDAERDALQTITDNYEHLYTDINDSLDQKLPGTKKAMRDDFLKESSHLHLNEGRIQFLHSEIARNKELSRERSEKMRAMAESQETVKEVIRQSQTGLTTMVGDMKQIQKISSQLCHMRDLTEKHMQMMKGDFKAGLKFGGNHSNVSGVLGASRNKFNTCM